MLYIQHRCNKVADLQGIEPGWGTEIDLRSDVANPSAIHLEHDPWKRGEDLRVWIQAWAREKNRGPLILNTKEDYLEVTAAEIMREHGVANYFFLDTQIPTLVRLHGQLGPEHFAVRVSSYEPIAAAHLFKGKAHWAWIDCFHGKPFSHEELRSLQGFKLCLVSPELQGHPLPSAGPQFIGLARMMDAICTKDPHWWTTALR